MSSTVLLYLIPYLALATFIGVVGYRSYRIYKMPLHLRWELYPVAHEMGDKSKYGGSSLEEVDWWTHPRKISKINELKAMLPEMTFLVLLYEQNRKLWWRSFPFHFGLYILTGLLILLVAGAILELSGIPVTLDGSALGVIIFYLTLITAIMGLTLATLGAAGLLMMRLTDPDLKDFTSGSTLFNLIFFLTVLAIALLTFLFVDPAFELTRSYFQNLLTLNVTAPVGSSLLALEIVLAVILIAYIPMTHMSHFFIKWFTWHKIRWDDEPNSLGSHIEKKILEQVQYPVSWSAPHINADGKKNWVDIATEDMEQK